MLMVAVHLVRKNEFDLKLYIIVKFGFYHFIWIKLTDIIFTL